jgi:hypothetical protein
VRSEEHAQALPPSDSPQFFPSIYLNLAFNYEILALELYRRADEYAGSLPDDDYGRDIRAAIDEGLARLEVVGKPWQES